MFSEQSLHLPHKAKKALGNLLRSLMPEKIILPLILESTDSSFKKKDYALCYNDLCTNIAGLYRSFWLDTAALVYGT